MYHMTHKLSMQETSPHAWNRQPGKESGCIMRGNISTCVEQTSVVDGADMDKEKHLHMRGAD